MDQKRADKIGRAVADALGRWQEPVLKSALPIPPRPAPRAEVVQSLPRRPISHSMGATHIALPMARMQVFRPGIVRPILRLGVWAAASLRFFWGTAVDMLARRNTTERRAQRLRRVLEETGASFAKVGQQLSLRADLLPYAYCVELSKMLDQAKPISSQAAIDTIERSLGRPLSEIFAAFDPEPIGSASIACVYQATLKSGERVAVKVRRPGIGPTLAADLRALDWLLILAEALTVIRPGFTTRFRQELKKVLMAELNFRSEARYTDIFRQRAKEKGSNVTAPRVFFDYSTAEVLVTELMAGVWMWELMAAVDASDHAFLAYASSLGIEPKAVAQNLLVTVHRELLEELFFHGDPHPANLVVLPDNRICFIDFGAVGRFSTRTRNMWRELHHHMKNRDVGRMVACTLNLSGPLPPIDVEKVIKAVEDIYSDWVYAISCKHSEWWERSTSQNWLRYINVARENGLPVSLETIQFFRSTVLYDSIITRLDRDIDFDEGWKVYADGAAKEARRRFRKNVAKRRFGPVKTDYLRFEQAADIAMQSFFKFQQNVEEPLIRFRNIVGKIAYSISLMLKLASIGAILVVAGLVARFVAREGFGVELDGPRLMETFASFGWVQVVLLIVGTLLIRRILFRVNEPDTKPE